MPFKIPGRKVNLRTMVPSDLEDYDRWNNPDLKVWDFDGPWYNTRRPSMEGTRNRLEDNRRPPYTSLEIETADGIHVGFVMAHYRENDPHMTEIGIRIYEEDYWNRGLGTEAMFLWVDYLFREWKFTRIGFSSWSGNHRVIAIGQNLGFVQEACIRKGCEVGGKFYDRIKMGILREEWMKQKSLS